MSARNMFAMFGAMAVLRRIDQEEPLVLLYARVAYLAYVGFTALVYIILHYRIIARKDTTLLKVSKSSKAPSFSEALQEARKAAENVEDERKRENKDDDEISMTSIVASETTENDTSNSTNRNEKDDEDADADADADDKKEEMETITVMEYDLRHLANARRSWVTSSCFLAAVHYHMESVSPLVMSVIMGLLRLVSEDPLVQIHLRGNPSVGKLARPFTAEKNPLANLLKDFAPKESKPDQPQESSHPEEDLHDDGDDDDEDESVSTIQSLREDNIKSDFDDEDTVDTKKTK